MDYRTADELTAGWTRSGSRRPTEGTVELIVRRPAENEREVLDEGLLDLELGLVGDAWKARGSSRSPDGSANLDAQLTLMNARAAQAHRGQRASAGRSPATSSTSTSTSASRTFRPAPASRSARRSSRSRPSRTPGCAKFSARFGTEALKFVNKSPGRELRLRGVNTRVVTPGAVRAGDAISKL